MSRIEMEIPENTLKVLKLSPQQIAQELRLMGAIKLYELGRLSSGAAAELAGVSRVAFLSMLADFGVPSFDFSKEELEKEVRFG